MAYFAIVPAAGSGSRMGSALPKQYLMLAGQPLIYHSLHCLLEAPQIDHVFVALAPDDSHWKHLTPELTHSKLSVLYVGGATRSASVANALQSIASRTQPDDWVLVHDAARPCLTSHQVNSLITSLAGDAVGGLLAMPVADTLKRADIHNRVECTVARENLWQAQTPQMFRYAQLKQALDQAHTQNINVTDEASAIEALGLEPRLIQSTAHNFKVTHPQDLILAEHILSHHERTL